MTAVLETPAVSDVALNPDVIAAQIAPLRYTEGRGPVSDAEVLGLMRRLALNSVAKRRSPLAEPLPTELPAGGNKSENKLFRFHPTVAFRAQARSEVEGRSLTDVVTEFLIAYGEGAPHAPAN